MRNRRAAWEILFDKIDEAGANVLEVADGFIGPGVRYIGRSMTRWAGYNGREVKNANKIRDVAGGFGAWAGQGVIVIDTKGTYHILDGVSGMCLSEGYKSGSTKKIERKGIFR